MMVEIPKLDRTKTEHIATVERIIWLNHDEQAIIIGLDDGIVAVGKGLEEQFSRGQRIRFLGRFEDSPKHGLQFRFSTFISDTPNTRKGQIDYLVTYAPNIGRVTAEKLANAYGEVAVETLRKDPARVASDGIMSASAANEAAQELVKLIALEKTKIGLFDLFKGRGFPGKLIDACIAKFGAKAPLVVRRNPFTLLVRQMPGAGFKRCDRMWIDFGKPANALKRQMFCGLHELRENNDGHTWHPGEKFVSKLLEAIPNSDPKKAILFGLRAKYLRKRRDENNQLWLAEATKAVAEQRIVDRLKVLLTGPVRWPDSLPVSQVDGDGLPSQHQVEIALKAISKPVGILAGSPGTGKTFSLAFILREIIRRYGSDAVVICAPTGKAAVRATQSLQRLSLPVRAQTIHRTLGIGRNGHDGQGWGFIHNLDNPLPFRFVIVDETSMVDTSLMADLLDATLAPTEDKSGTQVLFIGDPHQLPPVGHGAPLRDLIQSERVGYGELTEIRRNAGQIVQACHSIKHGERFETAEKIDVGAGANLRFLETKDENETLEVLERILAGMKSFDPVWETQILTPLNEKSKISRKPVNDRLRNLLNPGESKLAFRPGDKIICLRNCRAPLFIPNKCREQWGGKVELPEHYLATGDEEFLANGETGRVFCVNQICAMVRFREDHQGDEIIVRIWLPKKKRDAKELEQAEEGTASQFDLAYAISGHKSQGSESPCIIILADPAAGLVAGREWWYTCISRASKLCLIIGQRFVVDKQCARIGLSKRKTFLVELLREIG